MLKEYLKGKNKSEFAREIDISRQQLDNIIKNKSPKTQVDTCIKILKSTGLNPWDYLEGLDNLGEMNRGSASKAK